MKLSTAEHNRYLSWLLTAKDIAKEMGGQDSLENIISRLELKLKQK